MVVGQNFFRRDDQQQRVGEIFHLDPAGSAKVIEKYQTVMASRDQDHVTRTLRDLSAAASSDSENLMPYLVDCCLAYATVGEMVAALKEQWGEFQEPIRI